MKSELVDQFVATIEAEVRSSPSGMEFEMAYQTRVAIDRIKLAVKQTEEAAGRTDRIREAGLLLLDALDRLQSVERRFQQRSGHTARCERKDGIVLPTDRLGRPSEA